MFYDPLGIISPITLPVKLLLKELFKSKLDLDTEINNTHWKIWNNYIKGLQSAKHVYVERRVFCCSERKVELHGFCDSLGKALGAVIYARVSCCGRVKVTLWSGECRIAPSRCQSIPRLELLSCVLLGKLMDSVLKAISEEVIVTDVYCWSDSQIALWRIKQTGKVWKSWVQKRVEVIRLNCHCDNWFYVHTSHNPADITTRSYSPQTFSEKQLWWNRPTFLSHLEFHLPSNYTFHLPPSCDIEEKHVTSMVTVKRR